MGETDQDSYFKSKEKFQQQLQDIFQTTLRLTRPDQFDQLCQWIEYKQYLTINDFYDSSYNDPEKFDTKGPSKSTPPPQQVHQHSQDEPTEEPTPETSTQTLVNKCLAESGIDPTDIQKMSCQCLIPKGTFHPMNLQDKYKPIKDMYLQGSINPNTTILMNWIPLTPQVQYQPLSKLPVMTHTTPSVLIA